MIGQSDLKRCRRNGLRQNVNGRNSVTGNDHRSRQCFSELGKSSRLAAQKDRESGDGEAELAACKSSGRIHQVKHPFQIFAEIDFDHRCIGNTFIDLIAVTPDRRHRTFPGILKEVSPDEGSEVDIGLESAVAQKIIQRTGDQLGGIRGHVHIHEAVVVLIPCCCAHDAVGVFQSHQPGTGIERSGNLFMFGNVVGQESAAPGTAAAGTPEVNVQLGNGIGTPMHHFGPDHRCLIVAAFLKHLEKTHRISVKIGIFRGVPVRMDTDDVEAASEFIGFLKEQICFSDTAFGTHIAGRILSGKSLGIALVYAVHKGFEYQRTDPGSFEGSTFFAPPLHREPGNGLTFGDPDGNVGMFCNDLAHSIFEFFQIFRCGIAVGVIVVVTDKDPGIGQAQFGGVFLHVSDGKALKSFFFCPEIAEKIGIAGNDFIFFLQIVNLFVIPVMEEFRSDTQLLPSFKHLRIVGRNFR